MTTKYERDTVWAAAKRAEQLPYINLTALGRAAGFSQASFFTFRKQGIGGMPKVQRLGEILEQLNLIPTFDPAVTHYPPIQCPYCNQTTPRQFGRRILPYCGLCGQPLGQPCWHCGEDNDVQARFCASCGVPMTQDAYQQLKQHEPPMRIAEAHFEHYEPKAGPKS